MRERDLAGECRHRHEGKRQRTRGFVLAGAGGEVVGSHLFRRNDNVAREGEAAGARGVEIGLGTAERAPDRVDEIAQQTCLYFEMTLRRRNRIDGSQRAVEIELAARDLERELGVMALRTGRADTDIELERNTVHRGAA